MTSTTGSSWTARELLAGLLSLPELRAWAVLLIGAAMLCLTGVVTAPSLPATLGLLGAGALLWTTLEYALHRWLLHMPVPRQPWLRRVHRRLHWQHHQDPSDLANLSVPLWGSLSLHLMAIGAGFLLGGPQGVLPTFLGFSITFGLYEWMHLAAHVPYRPRTPWGRAMKRRHAWHHFKNEGYWFGVTHPVLDRLLMTSPRPSGVPRSPTARDLSRSTEEGA